MKQIRNYVDSLFEKMPKTRNEIEVKDELYHGLVGEYDDLLIKGVGESEALKIVEESVPSIDGVLEENQLTNIREYRLDGRKRMTLYSVLAWLFTCPLLILGNRVSVIVAFIIACGCGGSYFIARRQTRVHIDYLNLPSLKRRSQVAFIVWGIWYLTITAIITGILFGSNIWFAKPVVIKGAYELISLIAYYYIPLLTVFIPISIKHFERCAQDHKMKNERLIGSKN